MSNLVFRLPRYYQDSPQVSELERVLGEQAEGLRVSESDTLRQARLGLSRIRRMAIIVAASLGRLALALARAVITHVPIRFTSAKHSSMKPMITPYITAWPA